MSLRDFQRALCDLIASPRLCLRMRERPEEVLARYELTPREARRLTSVVWQRGMSVNCTLYRVNRVTPVYSMLPLTCFLLGDALLPELETFWAEFTDTDLQYKTEIQRFAAFLHRRIEQGHVDMPCLAEVLEFELAVNELRFTSRRRILEDLDRSSIGDVRRAWRAHPLVRVLSFRHDPTVVLGDVGGAEDASFRLRLRGVLSARRPARRRPDVGRNRAAGRTAAPCSSPGERLPIRSRRAHSRGFAGSLHERDTGATPLGREESP
jgi:hypothetical protein